MTNRSGRERRAHDAFRLLVAAAIDGPIDPVEAEALEAHLGTCPSCRADQQAMFEDHVWLATPARVGPPNPNVRTSVLEAARSKRVPRTSGADRPWSALAAAALVVATIAGGLWLANRGVPPFGSVPSASPSAEVSAQPSIVPAQTMDADAVPSDGVPFARFTGRATGRGETIGELDLVVSVVGLGANARGTVEISRNGEESWSGTISSATYWHGSYGSDPHRVAYIEGCRVGVSPCEAYVLQLFDGGASAVYLDDVRFWLPVPGATEPPDATRVYLVVDGNVVIGGAMPAG